MWIFVIFTIPFHFYYVSIIPNMWIFLATISSTIIFSRIDALASTLLRKTTSVAFISSFDGLSFFMLRIIFKYSYSFLIFILLLTLKLPILSIYSISQHIIAIVQYLQFFFRIWAHIWISTFTTIVNVIVSHLVLLHS